MTSLKALISFILIYLSCSLPAFSQRPDNLQANVQPLGGDRYRVSASGTLNSHPIGAKFDMHTVSDTGDTLVLEVTMTKTSEAHTQTVWRWRAQTEITVPKRIERVEVRYYDAGMVLPLPNRAPSTTSGAP